jgi:hypothetical protein
VTDQLPALTEPVESTTLTPLPRGQLIPALVAAAGDQAAWRYIDFFTANIRMSHPSSMNRPTMLIDLACPCSAARR